MEYVIGIDIGTSSTKSILLAETGEVVAIGQRAYNFEIPRPGWAEQAPDVWWHAAQETLQHILQSSRIDPRQVKGIGFSGQMHGPVFLNAEGHSLRPAIIWADQRSARECQEIYELVGKDGLSRMVGNPVDSGFMAATLLWMKRHEPDLYHQIHTLLLPKDYVKFRLTGERVTDPSDAGGTSLYDVRHLTWSQEILEQLDLRPEMFPRVASSSGVIGAVTAEAAHETGLTAGTPVVNGGNDQTMAALASGIIAEGPVLVMLSTGGTVFTTINMPVVDPELRMHTYPHCLANRWHLLGAILSGGLSLRWFRDILGDAVTYDQMMMEAAATPPGAEGLIFLPYLAGERTPHMDSFARGVFFGLTVRHTRGHLVRAIMEGVASAIRDCLELFTQFGVNPQHLILGGGGARSAVWQQIQADLLNLPVVTVQTPEASATGAAMLAGIGTGVFSSFQEACEKTVKRGRETQSRTEYRDLYAGLYQTYRALYPALQQHFRALAP